MQANGYYTCNLEVYGSQPQNQYLDTVGSELRHSVLTIAPKIYEYLSVCHILLMSVLMYS